MRPFAVSMCVLGAAGLALARPEVVVPNISATTANPGAGSLVLLNGAGYSTTYQLMVDGGQLSQIPVGSLITGVSWRLRAWYEYYFWPENPYYFNDYDMYLAPAALPVGSGSIVFANNVGPGEVQVRDGPLFFPLPATFFNYGPHSVNPFGMLIEFDTPYTYTGGAMVFTARHPGATTLSAPWLEYVEIPMGLANGVEAFFGLGAGATVGHSTYPVVFQFTWMPGPPCYPDCTANGVLTVGDFACFQTRFVLGDPYADCNGNSFLGIGDFACFQTRFVGGCP